MHLSLHCSLLIGGKILKSSSTPRHRMEIKLFYSFWKHVEKLLHSWNLFGTRETICGAASKTVEEEILIWRHPNKHWSSFPWKSRSNRALEIIRNTWKNEPILSLGMIQTTVGNMCLYRHNSFLPLGELLRINFLSTVSGTGWAEFPKFSLCGLKGELCV